MGKKTNFDRIKFNYYTKKGFVFNKNSLKIKKSIVNFFVNYINDLVVISNDQTKIKTVNTIIKHFLRRRGLKAQFFKSKIKEWENNIKLNYLGFTFYCVQKKIFSAKICLFSFKKKKKKKKKK